MQRCLKQKQNTCCYACMYKLEIICSEDVTYWATNKKPNCFQRQCIIHNRVESGIQCSAKLIPCNTSSYANYLSELTPQNVWIFAYLKLLAAGEWSEIFVMFRVEKQFNEKVHCCNQDTEHFHSVFVKGALVVKFHGIWDHRITESQNHRMLGVGRDLCGSSSPTLLLKQGRWDIWKVCMLRNMDTFTWNNQYHCIKVKSVCSVMKGTTHYWNYL